MDTMVVYQSILNKDEPLETLTFLPKSVDFPIYIQEAYCSNPDCDCYEAYLVFHRLTEDYAPVNELFRFRLGLRDNHKEDIEIQDHTVPSETIMEEFFEHLDEFEDDLNRHYHRLKQHFRTFIPLDQHPILYKRMKRGETIDYRELFSGEILRLEDLGKEYLIIDSYLMDPHNDALDVELTIVEVGKEPMKLHLDLKSKAFRVKSGKLQNEVIDRILKGELFLKLQQHARLMKEAGLSVEKTQKFTSVGRNEPCPCGSGKKFKHCHGR